MKSMGFGRTFPHADIVDMVCVGKAYQDDATERLYYEDALYDTFSNLGEKDCTFYHGNTYAGHHGALRLPPCASMSGKYGS